MPEGFIQKHAHWMAQLSGELFIVLSRDGQWVEFNKRWEELTQWLPIDMLGSLYTNIVHCSDVDATRHLLQKTVNEPGQHRILNRIRRKNGQLLWIDWRLQFDPDSQLIFAMGTDVTQWRSAASTLEATQSMTRTGHWRVDIGASQCWWSPITYQIHEVPEGTPIPLEKAISFYVDEHRQIITGAVERAIATGEGFQMDLQIVTARGKHKWVRAWGQVVRDGARVVAIEGVFQDIDAQKSKEIESANAIAQLQKYEVALNEHSLVTRTDSAGTILACNDKMCSTSKFSREELIGKSHNIVNSGYHPPEFFRKMWQTISAGRIWRGEICNKAKDGSIYWVDTSITPFRNERGRVQEYLAIRVDITDRKIAEEKLNEERRRVLEANRAKSQFLAAMSHEIRTPMNGILGITSVLSGELDGSKYSSRLKVIEDCGSTLVSLLNDILDYSKIEAGRMELEEAPFNLSQLIDSTIAIFDPKAAEKSLFLRTEISETVPQYFRGDRRRIGQILFNLISNAIKFTVKGGITLAVDGSPDSSGACELNFSIRDSGDGIAPETLQRLFSPFVQADASISRRHGGTGLGLAICKTLAELMNGGIDVKSVVGQGSEFSFRVRLEVTTAVAAENLIEKRAPTARLSASALPLRILVAEDNRVNRMVVGSFLSKLGYTPDFAENGQQAVEATMKHDYDVIFMDMAMPFMDGLEATRIIRSNPRLQHIHIVALTANALNESREECIAAGMNDFVSKPISMSDIEVALCRLAPVAGQEIADLTGAEADEIDEARLTEIIDLFHGDLDGLLSDARRSFAKGLSVVQGRAIVVPAAKDEPVAKDPVRAALHELKGIAGNLGGTGVVKCLTRIQAQGVNDETTAQLTHSIDHLLQEVASRASVKP